MVLRILTMRLDGTIRRGAVGPLPRGLSALGGIAALQRLPALIAGIARG